MNSTTKYQKLRLFFVIDFCFGPRQIAGFVAVRDVTTFRAADSHSVSGDEWGREREKQAIFNDMNMNDEWEMMNMNVQRAQARSTHKTHSRSVVVVVVAVGNVSAAAGERDEQLVPCSSTFKLLRLQKLAPPAIHQSISVVEFSFECKNDLCLVFEKKIWNLAPTAATNQNFFKKCLKCLKWALERFQNISRQFTSLSVNTR